VRRRESFGGERENNNKNGIEPSRARRESLGEFSDRKQSLLYGKHEPSEGRRSCLSTEENMFSERERQWPYSDFMG